MVKRERERIMTIIVLIVIGTIAITVASVKIWGASLELAYIHEVIMEYNSSDIKDDEWTQESTNAIEYRQEKFYESEDWLIRTYSNLPWFLKTGVIFLDILIVYETCKLYVEFAKYIWDEFCKELEEKKQRKRRAR